MSKSIAELINEATTKGLADAGLKDVTAEKAKETMRQIKYLTDLMSERSIEPRPFESRISISEALQAPDMSILFPKAVSNVLLKPKEPIMIGQTLLAKTVMAPNVRSLEMPVLGSVRAFDLADSQEFPEVQPSFAQRFQEIKTTRSGAMISVGEDVINDSMWDILGLMIESVGYAMLRHKEEKIFKTAVEEGHVVYDNSIDDPNAWTSGKARDGVTPNFTAGFDEFFTMMGNLISFGYVPTDIVMHPMAWQVFATDPVLRANYMTQGQIGQSVWKNMPNFDQSQNMPWQVAYQVTPFMKTEKKTLKAVASGGTALDVSATLPSCLTTDVMVLDRQEALLILQKETMSMQDWPDYIRECRKIKVRERYGIGARNEGRAISLMKNIRVDRNYNPAMIIGTVTPA